MTRSLSSQTGLKRKPRFMATGKRRLVPTRSLMFFHAYIFGRMYIFWTPPPPPQARTCVLGSLYIRRKSAKMSIFSTLKKSLVLGKPLNIRQLNCQITLTTNTFDVYLPEEEKLFDVKKRQMIIFNFSISKISKMIFSIQVIKAFQNEVFT